ncbi:DUF1801 domain-containing protein [Methylophilus sp. 3sh_L]|uniref:DUF1801 domain-containing protein n=1 Tax=Methylophilus sp. 3sh_L TaxID=3377114 RepID=UPI00398EB16B
MSSSSPQTPVQASKLIDQKIAGLHDWRGAVLSNMRALIHDAIPDVIEEVKWMGTPVWSKDGIICTGETYQSKVKLTFIKGAMLEDPATLFNSSLEGNTRRAIDIFEGAQIDVAAFKALIQAAAAHNGSSNKAR